MKKLLCTLITASALNTFADSKKPETVIVSATRSETKSIDIPANIQVISREDIRQSGAASISDVLQGHAGIVIQDVIGSRNRGATVSMRGFSESSANNVLILVDGRKLNNPSMISPDLSSIAMKDIERIEIINGSAGTLYGEQSSGGVINVITKKPEKLSGFIETTVGNNDHQGYAASLGDKLANGLNYRVSGNKQLDDNYRDNNEATYENYLGNIGYEGKVGRAFVEAQHIEDDMRYAGSLSRQKIQDDRQQTLTPDDFSDRTTDINRVGTFLNLNPDWEIGGEYTYRDQEGEGLLYGSPFTESTTVKTWNPRLNGETVLFDKNIVVTVGGDFQKTDYRYFSNFEQKITDWYAQTIIDVVTDLKLTLGGRVSEVDEKNTTSLQNNDDSLEVYQIGLSYQLNNTSRVFIRRDESFRWANVDENALALPGINFLKPQQSTSKELGYEYRDDTFSVDAVLYQLDLTDELMYDSEINNPNSYFGMGANINLDNSTREGLTLGGSWKINKQWKLNANTSFTDSEFESGSFKGNKVPYVAEKTASATVTYTPDQHWSVFVQAVHTGERYAASDYFNNAGELGGYTTYNANLRYELNNWYGQLRLDNIGSKEYNGFTYVGGSGYPAPEATARLSVGYAF